MDFKDNAIILDTAAAPESTPTPIPTVKNNLKPLPEVEVETVDGKEYVRKSNIEKMLDSIGLSNYEFAGPYFYDKNNRMVEPLLNDIQLHPTHNTLIPLEYYINVIVPIINSLR